MPEPVKVNVVSYGGVKPGQMVVGNTASGEKTTIFDAATATHGDYMFYGCAALTSWNVDLPELTRGHYMFQSCAALTSWNVDLPELTGGVGMFSGCAALASLNVILPKLTNGNSMFFGCAALTSWNVDLPELTTGDYMFYDCAALTSWNVDLPKLTSGTGMFERCALSAESVNLILNSIPDRATAGLAVAKLGIGKRTNFKTDPDVKALLGETGAEITAKTYRFKGWDVLVQN